MAIDRLVLAPALPGLQALGVGAPEALLEGDLGPRAESLSPGNHGAAGARGSGEARSRVPLPGTPGADGRLSGWPGGAGTGWVVVQRWIDPGLRELFGARFTAPRSASLAERHWNLLCHLRRSGVGTAEPLAVGARGAGLTSRRSFLVTRELRGFVPLDRFALREHGAQAEERALEAAGTFFARLLRSGFLVDSLRAESVRVSVEPEGPQGCEDQAPVGLERNRLPGFVLADVGGGRLTARFEPRGAGRMLRSLAMDLRAAGVRRSLLWKVLRRATRAACTPSERRELWRELREPFPRRR